MGKLVIHYTNTLDLWNKLQEELKAVEKELERLKRVSDAVEKIINDVRRDPCKYINKYDLQVDSRTLIFPMKTFAKIVFEKRGILVDAKTIEEVASDLHHIGVLHNKVYITTDREVDCWINSPLERIILERVVEMAMSPQAFRRNDGVVLRTEDVEKNMLDLSVSRNKITRVLKKYGVVKTRVRLYSRRAYVYFIPWEVLFELEYRLKQSRG